MADRRFLWALIVLAVALRAGAVLVLQSHTIQNSTYEHGTIASNLLAGRGFATRFLGVDGPTSQQAPVYPLLVAGAYALGGGETPCSLLLLELGQALLGGVLVAGAAGLAREVAPGRVGVARLSGLMVAVYPTLVYAATHVQVALLAATLVTWTLAWAYRAGRTGRGADCVVTGVVFATLVLTDPILGLAGVGVYGAVALGRTTHGLVRPLAIILMTSALCVLPWTVRNFFVHGELVAVKTTFGYAFWQGNCALSEGTDKVRRASVERTLRGASPGARDWNATLWTARHEAGYLDDVALSASDYSALKVLSEPERSRVLFRRALADLDAAPGRYASLCLRRLRYFVLFDETNPKTRSLLYRVPHLALTFLAALGLVLVPGALQRRLAPTIATASLVAAFHVLTIVSARFHIPLEPLLGLWAACGLDAIRPRYAATRTPAEWSPAPLSPGY
jgi:hypothetical protein